MSANVAGWDRIGRVAIGIALLAVGLIGIGGGLGWALTAGALIPLETGLSGWCPIYAVLGHGTGCEFKYAATRF